MSNRIPRNLIRHLEWTPGTELPPSPKPGTSPGTGSRDIDVTSSGDFWSISGVPYGTEFYTVDLLKTLLNEGNAKTQDEWIEFRKEAIPKNEFYTGDMPLQHALFTTLYKLRDDTVKKDEVETIKEFVKKPMFERWLATTTRIMYQPSGSLDDVIIHNNGM